MRPRLRWTLGMALPMAAAVLISPAGAREKPRAAGQDALAVRVVSSPPRLVSGGAARVKVAVPGGVALADVAVELNGSDVTAAFWPDRAACSVVRLGSTKRRFNPVRNTT